MRINLEKYEERASAIIEALSYADCDDGDEQEIAIENAIEECQKLRGMLRALRTRIAVQKLKAMQS